MDSRESAFVWFLWPPRSDDFSFIFKSQLDRKVIYRYSNLEVSELGWLVAPASIHLWLGGPPEDRKLIAKTCGEWSAKLLSLVQLPDVTQKAEISLEKPIREIFALKKLE